MNLDSPALTFGLALAAGMMAQVGARHLRIPGIVLLLVMGILLGPDVANVVRPATLGGGLRVIVGAAVALILFEGGLQLEIDRLRREAPIIRRLITWGAAVTAIGATLAARVIMGWPWAVAAPFGTLVTVTGPTVIGPLLRRMRLNRNLHTILEAEAVLIDPIGAVLAVVTLEVVLNREVGSAAAGLLGIPTRLLFGTVVGAAGGWALARALGARRLVPQDLVSVFTLAVVLALYALCEAILPESGIMAAPVAGIVVGNAPGLRGQDLKEFKEQLTILLVGLLFVLLAADVRLAEVRTLGARGALTVAVLMLLVRPVTVAVGTAGSQLALRERAFLAWLGPRGIVAAAVASLFAEELVREGIPEGVQLRALVFLVIAATVTIQGLGGGAVARLLGVRRASDVGWVIAGANPVARALGGALRAGGEEVVLLDTDRSEVAIARDQGLDALLGNALDDEILESADLGGRRGIVALIPNEAVGTVVAEKARRDFRVPNASVAVRPGRVALVGPGLQRIGARLAFGAETDLVHWAGELTDGEARLRRFRYAGGGDPAGSEEGQPGVATPAGPEFLLLTLERRGRVSPVDDASRFRRGDVVTALMVAPGDAEAPPGFEPLEPPAAGS